ncbi:transmembrane protein, putative (macronuclear) [Tetrahymena thermophila SB210]|uniref:Transmembrane protein, putative n=1 Tax=Tetrahymena thermophila (strain SB210) TaxID=312017 RepID=I7M2H0_TETTS|nr:transmembrane protein, putative [Tetrahymena thermophila SB210]EAS00373.2 transmembrane protein, putative [Tetrahymena thermophila SB210]|eukprot:XP_001020618.2 transmembrane protein, putative [Tetrahymena thermophila SB210]
MCHSTCATCNQGKNTFADCTACNASRYLFDNSCLCPKGQDTDSSYNCYDFDSSVSNLQDFVYALQYGLLSLMIISLFIKRHIPLTRKLLDTCQTIGLLFYIHQYYEPRTTVAFQLFQMTNLSTLIPNYIANHFYGQDMQLNASNTYTYLNMGNENQTPDYKFLINGKSSNFLINQLQVFVIWAVGLILFLVVGAGISIINQGKGFCEYIRFNFMNYVYIIFYFTFQESFLNLFLQLKNLQWTQAIHYISLGILILYFVLALFIIRSILISQNSYPKDQIQKKIEIFRRRDQCHFLFAFEDPLTDISIQEKSEKSAQSPTEIVTSSWIVLSLIQKLIMTGVIVFQYNNKVEISLIVIIVIFFKLFFLIRPIKNKVILIFSFLADCYVVVVIILSVYSYLVYLLWPGILVLNFLMILEDVFSSKFYPTVQEVNYLEKITHLQQNEEYQQNQKLNYQKNQELVVQNIAQSQNNPQHINNNLSNQQNQLDYSIQIPLKNSQQQEQSVLIKQDNSMTNQNLAYEQSLNQERLESQQYAQKSMRNNIPEVINISQNQNNQHAITDKEIIGNLQKQPPAVQPKAQNQQMIEMKQKYLERMRKQNESLLQKQPTQAELKKPNLDDEYDLINGSNQLQNNQNLNKSKQNLLFYGPENISQNNQNNFNNKKNQLSDVALKDSDRKSNKNNNIDKDSFFDTQEEYDNDYSQLPSVKPQNSLDKQQFNQNKEMQNVQQKRQNSYQQQPDRKQSLEQKKIDEELSNQWKFN